MEALQREQEHAVNLQIQINEAIHLDYSYHNIPSMH